MLRKDQIKELYFDNGYNQTEISKLLNISVQYISQVLLKDDRYKQENEKRKKSSQIKHKQDTVNYIRNKRKTKGLDIEYEVLKQKHRQDRQELSGAKNKISNRAYRDWNTSAYRYNEKSKSYILRKDITAGADVPKKINWKNY